MTLTLPLLAETAPYAPRRRPRSRLGVIMSPICWLVKDCDTNRRNRPHLIGTVHREPITGIVMTRTFALGGELGEKHRIVDFGRYGMEVQRSGRQAKVFTGHTARRTKPSEPYNPEVHAARCQNWIDAVVWASNNPA